MAAQKKGRPSNRELIKRGELIVSKSCKVCQSPVRDEITQCLLRGISGTKIIEKYGHHFDPPLTPTNLHSHKQHMNPEAVVTEDRKRAIAASTQYDEATKQLFQQKYDETFDKSKAADDLYKKRLENLFHIQKEIESLNAEETINGGFLPDHHITLRRKLIQDLEVAYKGFNQDLIKHIALDADLYVKQVNIQFINTVHRAFLTFTNKFIDVLVKEIPDAATRERVKEHLGELLDNEIAPILDPDKAVDTDYEVMDDGSEI